MYLVWSASSKYIFKIRSHRLPFHKMISKLHSISMASLVMISRFMDSTLWCWRAGLRVNVPCWSLALEANMEKQLMSKRSVEKLFIVKSLSKNGEIFGQKAYQTHPFDVKRYIFFSHTINFRNMFPFSEFRYERTLSVNQKLRMTV